MADLILKVAPDEVSRKAKDIDTQKGIMEGLLKTMGGYVQTLERSWDSDAGKEYVQKYESVKREIQDSLNNLQTHVHHLDQAAEAYRNLEQEQQQKVKALSDSDIF